MSGSPAQAETHTLRGAVDRPALLTIRDVIEKMEPLATPALDDFLDPTVLEVELDDGLAGADTARIDVQWTTRDDYKFHYTDSEGVNLRWGSHPHDGDYVQAAGDEHYHPPPNASSDANVVEASCITKTPEVLVTRAVLKLWRVAHHGGSLSALNAGQNPP
ncbi:hypothetical protein [Halobaculum sp. MBLA0143]|uniref:hypothetical protein n=1 Tax=Halobaculum sp. MBLA0143 TaxID=3079933 RepID=UPI00352437D3